MRHAWCVMHNTPKYGFTGTGMDLPLLQWLERYTFPVEARFKDALLARKVSIA